MNKKEGWKSPETSQQYMEVVTGEVESENYYRKHYYHDPFFFGLLPNLNGLAIAEIGAGELYMAHKLQEMYPGVASYIALDLPNMIAMAVDRQVDAVGADAEKLPFKSESVDVVLASLLLHWVNDKNAVISEANRVLKSGGTFVASLAHPDSYYAGKYIPEGDTYRFEKHTDTSVYREFEIMLSNLIGPVTYYGLPAAEYPDLLRNNDFINTEVFSPTVDDPEIAKLSSGLRKNQHQPLFMFLKANKK